MLSQSFSSQRPVPPAKMRRSSTLHNRLLSESSSTRAGRTQSPPPYQANTIPYATSMPTLLGSPIAVTSQLMRSELPPQPPPTPQEEEWMNEKSRQELSELLLKAGVVINDRETELSLTSAVCKSLFENNLLLKSKHEALISRIPSTSNPSSPAHSRTSSIVTSSSTRSPIDTHSSSNLRRSHARRISASPSELALLAEQNSELLLRLQNLEEEAVRADHAGRRQLRDLERELRGLHDELERTRERSAHLEQQIQEPNETALHGLDGDLLKLWKKLDREARVREMRAKARPWEQVPNDEPRDFAPGSRDSTPVKPSFFSKRQHTPPDSIPSSPTDDISRSSEMHATLAADSCTDQEDYHRTRTISTSSLSNGREYAIVSQLLLKIRELEEANEQISKQHADTRDRLMRAEREAEAVSRTYESIGKEVGMQLEIEQDDDVDDTESLSMSTGTVRSLRPRSDSLNFTDTFGQGIGSQMCSTVRENAKLASVMASPASAAGEFEVPPHADKELLSLLRCGSQSERSRKSLRGLFDYSSDQREPSAFSPHSPSPIITSTEPSFSGALDDSNLSMNLAGWSSAPTTIDARSRNTSLCSNASFSLAPPGEGRRTLGSELGDDFLPGDSHYMRSASLCEYIGADDAGDDDVNNTATGDILPEARSEIDEEGLKSTTTSTRISSTETIHPVILYKFPSSSSKRIRSPLSSPPMTQSSPPSSSALLPVSPTVDCSNRNSSMTEGKKNALVSLVIELWLWLQFAIVIVVFLYAMARRGPRRVLAQPESRH